MIATLEHPTAGPLKLLGTPLRLSDTPGAIRTPPPVLGQHTEAVLTKDLGLTSEEVAALRTKGVV
jgi:crotonobetainyl-CoA:carnitine CoA-transferase CaiB-like acyl-CoA transferase